MKVCYINLNEVFSWLFSNHSIAKLPSLVSLLLIAIQLFPIRPLNGNLESQLNKKSFSFSNFTNSIKTSRLWYLIELCSISSLTNLKIQVDQSIFFSPRLLMTFISKVLILYHEYNLELVRKIIHIYMWF